MRIDSPSGPHSPERDRGMILIPTLILTLVLSVVVVAIAGYVMTGLRTSRVTTARTEGATEATAAMYWAVESLSTGTGVCEPVIVVPAAAMPQRTGAEVACAELVSEGQAEGDLRRLLLGVAIPDVPGGSVTAIVEYHPADPAPRAIRIADWSSDGNSDTAA